MMQEVANKCGLPLAERCPPASSGALDARRATATLFLVDGMTFGTWAALIPSFQHKFCLSAGELSWVLFGLVLGALISMPLTGQLVARVGSRSVASRAAFIFCATLLLLALVPSYATLIAAATLFGAAKGAVDVSMNAQAIAVENALRKPINSSFQAFWSVGGLGVAFLLSVAMNRGFSPKILMLVMVLVLSLLALTTVGRLLRDGPRSEAPPGFSGRIRSCCASAVWPSWHCSARAFSWIGVQFMLATWQRCRWPLLRWLSPPSPSAWRRDASLETC